MRKKWLVVTMAVTLGLSTVAMGCGQGDETLETPDVQTIEEMPEVDTTAMEDETVAEDETQPETAGAQELTTLTAEQENMLAVMDSLNMCMSENDYTYDPENPEFFWSALFYTIGNYPDVRDNSAMMEQDGVAGIMTVYYRLVQEYATGLFENYSDLLEVPEGSPVTVNEDTEYYDFMMGDRGLSYGKIVSWVDNGDGTHTVETQMLSAEDESIIADYVYTLVENPYADGITDPMFVYTVRSVEKVE